MDAEMGFIPPIETAPDVYAVGLFECGCGAGFRMGLDPIKPDAYGCSMVVQCPHCGTTCELTPERGP